MMIHRRGFMLVVFGGVLGKTAGLWLPQLGIVTLPRRMVLKAAGTCSMCAAGPPARRALVGVFGRPPRICDECTSLRLSILEGNTQAERETSHFAAAPRALDDLGPSESQTIHDAMDDLRRTAVSPPNLTHYGGPNLACEFCDAQRGHGRRFIEGWAEGTGLPPVIICDECLADASAVIDGALSV